MIELLYLIGIIVAATPVAVIILLVWQSRIAREVKALREAVTALQATGGSRPRTPVTPQASASPSAETRAQTPASPVQTGREAARIPVAATPETTADRAHPEPATDEEEAAKAALPPRAVVFRAERFAALGAWLRANWFLAVAAVSLALSGVFLVQYGAENGLLSPTVRVGASIALGACLIALGEWIRRRAGDRGGMTAFLPSAVSGAGLVCIFAGVLAARQLYGLIGPETAFAGLVAIGALALVLGWFYGPLLSSVGILGAMAAPFLVGGDASQPTLLYVYFGLVTIVGLGIDAVQRWAWVSVLSLGLGFGAGTLLYLGAGEDVAFLIFGVTLVIAAIAIPVRAVVPRHDGAMIAESIMLEHSEDHPTIWPEFPTRVAAGAMAAACVICVLIAGSAFWPAMIALAVLFGLAAVWVRQADALTDLAALPAFGYLMALWAVPRSGARVFTEFASWSASSPEASAPALATILLGGGIAGSVTAAWRSLRGAPYPAVWTAGAALFAPAVTMLLDILWHPQAVIGSGAWGLHVLVVAAVMTLLAERHARVAEWRDLRVSLLALAALGMIALALFTLATGAALTIALAVMAVVAAWLDLRFQLPQLAPFIQAAVAVTLWRLIAQPGVEWAIRADIMEVLGAYVLPLAAFAAGAAITRGQGRILSALMLETALWVIGGTFACVLIGRALPDASSFLGLPTYWEASLYGSIWLIAAGGQLNLMRRTGWLRRAHLGLACVFGALALVSIGAALTIFNPLFERTRVHGPVFLDTLIVAYGLPAALLMLAAWVLDHLARPVRRAFGWTAAALAALTIALEIRHFWRGDILSVSGTTPPELYSYTLALMAASALLLFGAVWRRSQTLRRLALIGAGLSIAKVFLIDMGSLTGLIRVAAFLGLGLSLVGLAWIDRWITGARGTDQ